MGHMQLACPEQGISSGHLPSARVQVLDLIDCGASEGGAEGRHWVLDPIDGTRGFVGLRQYAICLGMLQGGKARSAPFCLLPTKAWPLLTTELPGLLADSFCGHY